jgi:hypothetical protein
MISMAECYLLMPRASQLRTRTQRQRSDEFAFSCNRFLSEGVRR